MRRFSMRQFYLKFLKKALNKLFILLLVNSFLLPLTPLSSAKVSTKLSSGEHSLTSHKGISAERLEAYLIEVESYLRSVAIDEPMEVVEYEMFHRAVGLGLISKRETFADLLDRLVSSGVISNNELSRAQEMVLTNNAVFGTSFEGKTLQNAMSESLNGTQVAILGETLLSIGLIFTAVYIASKDARNSYSLQRQKLIDFCQTIQNQRPDLLPRYKKACVSLIQEMALEDAYDFREGIKSQGVIAP